MTARATDNNRDTTPADAPATRSAGTIERSRSLAVVLKGTAWQRLSSLFVFLWKTLHEKYQCTPLAYKLAFFITVLVVSCMMLFGGILVQQQTGLLQAQINDQGSTLVRLMAQSAKEPLLADDQLALNTIANSFSGGDSVVGTAIVSLEGQIISQAGQVHKNSTGLPYELRNVLSRSGAGSQPWQWQPDEASTPSAVMSFFHPVIFQDISAGYAVATYSQSGMQQFTRQIMQTITGATLLIIGLGIGMAFALGRRITQPIDKLVEASRAIGSGNYSFKFNESRQDELGLLMEAFNDMAQGMLEKSQVKSALSRYVSEGVAQKILSNLEDVELGGKQVEGTVLFADITGFTQIAETIKPEDLVAMLNRYFSLITCACEMNHGIVDKYMGDGVMLVFGTPEPDQDHAFHAIRCALLIQKLISYENEQREKQGLFPVKFRIGVNTGSMLAGNMGSRQRMEFTVVGDAVNLASRLCSITNGGQIVISREMYMRAEVTDRVLAGEYQPIRLRGISKPVSTYRVEALTADYQHIVDEQFDEILETDNTGVCNA